MTESITLQTYATAILFAELDCTLSAAGSPVATIARYSEAI